MPTTYINIKILPEDSPSEELLAKIESEIQNVFQFHGIRSYLHLHQIEKSS